MQTTVSAVLNLFPLFELPMSIAESSNLTRLLRLLTGVATTAESQQLRVRMRGDEQLVRQHAKLVQVMSQPFSLDNALLHLDEVDPEIVAAFVDDQLDDAEKTTFERKCWNSESLLREVVTAWRLEHDVNASEPLPAVDSSAVDSSAIDSSSASVQADFDSQMSRSKNQTVAKAVQTQTPPAIEPLSVVKSRARKRSHTGYHMATLALVSAAVFAAVLFGLWQWMRPGQQVPGGINTDSVVEQRHESEQSPEQNVAQNDQDVEPIEEQNEPQIPSPEMEVPEDTPPKNVIVDVPGRMPVDRPEEPRVPREPGILQPSPQSRFNMAKWLDWSDVMGIAATRDAAGERWRGIGVPRGYTEGENVDWLQVATLRATQLKGEDGKGASWTAGANTTFRISHPVEMSEGVVVCDLSSGKLAIENLDPGRTLVLRVDEMEFPLVVDEAGTTLVLERVGREIVMGAFRGSATCDGSQINRRVWRKVDGTGKTASLRPEKYDAWYNQKVQVDAPATLRNKLNNAPDFLAQVIDVSRHGTPLEQSIGAQAILRVNAAENQIPGDPALRSMMNSDQESVRAALVKWLAEQCLENPRYAMMMVVRLCKLQDVPEKQSRSFQEWFGGIARRSKYTQRVLDQLMASLTIDNKPIVRQAAKFFLEDYLREPLPYNPIKPGANITRVLAEVRKRVTEQQRRLER